MTAHEHRRQTGAGAGDDPAVPTGERESGDPTDASPARERDADVAPPDLGPPDDAEQAEGHPS